MARKGKLKARIREVDERPLRIQKYKFLILIVCEDQKTEKEYFEAFQRQFPDNTIYQRTVGTGLDPLGVVERAIQEREKLAIEARREVDRTWVVFDKDDADKTQGRKQRYAEALNMASQNNLMLADSNEVFELWPLLHLRDISPTSPIPRKEIYQMLQDCVQKNVEYITFEYKHGDTEILKVIAIIGSEAEAIERAKNLLKFHNGKDRIDSNPSTKVHLLVLDLREWIAYFSFEPD